MSVKSSARIKKRRSAEAAAATVSPSVGSFAAVSSQRLAVTGHSNNNNNNTSNNSNNNTTTTSSSSSSNNNPASSNNNINSSNQSLSKKQNFVGRNPNFDTDETKLLIQLWGDPKLQRTLITTHKKHAVICQLASKMQEYGYHRSPEEITTRIKNLKCFYNRLKKDKDSGLTGETEPSWKHFIEMDAIMTRPIFSVRPNEVPAPSLKYQLEQALEEHAERRKRRRQNGEDMSDSDNEEDDMLLSTLVPHGKPKPDDSGDNEAELQVDMDSEDTFVSSKRRKLSSEPDVDIDETLIKTEPANQSEPVVESSTPAVEAAAATATVASVPATVAAVPATVMHPEEDDDCMLLPLPKEEPIDVDAVEEVQDAILPSMGTVPMRSVMPTLADMLQLPKATNTLPYSGANVIIPANSISTSFAQVTSTVSTSCANNSKLAPGKISLVPTNFLMQPKQGNIATPGKAISSATNAQLQMLQNAISQGARLMISGAGSTPVQNTPNTSLVTGPGGVKFVLVNTEQATAAKAVAAVPKPNPTVVPTASLPQPLKAIQPKILQPTEYNQQQLQQQQHQQQQQQQQQQNQHLEKLEEKRRAQEKAREEQQSKRHMTTMRIMLRQLLNSQNEANEIQHNRLSLERERLDWEKSMGERLLTMLPTLVQPAPQAPAAATVIQPGPSHPQPQFIVSAAGPGGQRLQPPKLLFTTALPMANGTVSMPHILTPSSALATSLPKVIAAPASSSTSVNNSVSGGGVVSMAPKPVEICTQINDVQLVTPKLEKDG